ncbi:Helicase associated domain protein [Paenibacillus polymyxa]|uniref:Helicase associated domain protein n=1 Tax=Paenibacillus polymyxa TaxID=1406 RepID=UPI00307EBAC3
MTTHHDIELYPHNQETYEKIIEAWKTQNRVATVQATGTGKTFLILKCLFTYPNVNKVVLAPSNHILDQLSSKVDELPNTTLLTYSKLSFMSEEDIKQLDANMIVLDEFHRCGAEKWGEGVGKLIEIFPNAKILGTSATPIRFLDGERDMSDELFDGNVVTNLSLTEAIVKDILPMPTYVSALYTFDEEILNLKDKIDKSSNSDEEKENMYKEVEQLKKQLDKSKGISVILKKYLGNKTGKFIVFCRNKEHQCEMKKVVINWFKKAKIGEQIDTYTVYSGKTTNKKALEDFKSNKNNKNVRLLFTIDMLNEGLHVEDTDGVIFLRSTISPTLYYQQLGRTISVDNKEPYVFDFVNNFNSLSNGGFGSELRETVEKENKQRKAEGKEEFSLDDFVIYDDMQDVENLFDEIEGRLRDNWDVMFERYKSGERGKRGTKIGNWVANQRQLYKNKKLSLYKTEKLKSIGFHWNPDDIEWNLNYKLLLRFREDNGHCNVPRDYVSEGMNLGVWVSNQRQDYKSNQLLKERIDILCKIDFSWNVMNDLWNNNYRLLCKYKNKYGHVNVPVRYELDGIKLGVWVSEQRRSHKKNKIMQDRIDKLNAIGFQWEIGVGNNNPPKGGRTKRLQMV